MGASQPDGTLRITPHRNDIGGLTMPPLYWGDHRGEICEVVFDPAVSSWLPPGMGDHSTKICEAMGLSRPRLEQEAQRCRDEGGWDLYRKLLVHTFFQIESLGFEMIDALEKILAEKSPTSPNPDGTNPPDSNEVTISPSSPHFPKPPHQKRPKNPPKTPPPLPSPSVPRNQKDTSGQSGTGN